MAQRFLWLIRIAVVLAASCLSYKYADSQGKAALEKVRREHAEERATLAEEQAKEERRLRSLWLDEQTRADGLAQQLANEQRAFRHETDRLKKEIQHVTSQWRPHPQAALEPLPRCVFTHGFVRLYNDAIGAAVHPATVTKGGATETAAATDALDSGIDQASLLDHHIQYGERCRAIETQLNLLIDVYTKAEQ